MICELCHQDRELKKSHMIPRFVGKWLKANSETGYLSQSIRLNRRLQDFPTERRLCGDCETRFSRWETHFTRKVFLPYLNEGIREFKYDDWLLRFAVSLLWRLGISATSSFRTQFPKLASQVEDAISVWRMYLLNDVPMTQSYAFHLYFVDSSKPTSTEDYDRNTVDGTLSTNGIEVCGFVKLPSMVFFSGISPRHPSKMKYTRIHKQGELFASRQVISNSVLPAAYGARAYEYSRLSRVTAGEAAVQIRKELRREANKSKDPNAFANLLLERYLKSKRKAG